MLVLAFHCDTASWANRIGGFTQGSRIASYFGDLEGEAVRQLLVYLVGHEKSVWGNIQATAKLFQDCDRWVTANVQDGSEVMDV